MKISKLYAALACTMTLLTACYEDDFQQGGYAPAKPGDEILFGGSLTYETRTINATRTVYGDKGETGTEIKWYEGDKVRIYCEAATLGEGETTQKYCDYQVTDYIEKPVYDVNGNLTNPDTSNPKGDGSYNTEHSSGLRTADGNPGLRWGTGSHTFYGVYPASAQLQEGGDDVAANALKLEGNTLEAYLPNTQAPTRYVAPTKFTGKNYDGTTNPELNHYTIHPAMRNAYMVATETAEPKDGGVTLTFQPVVAAVEMTLVNNCTYTTTESGVTKTTGAELANISLINLTAASPICGRFKATIAENSTTIENISTDQSFYTIGIPVEDGNGNPVTLQYGDKITFTVFMILPDDLSSISVSVVAGGSTKTATLTGNNGVKIVQARKKNFIANVPIAMQNVEEVKLSDWISQIPNESADGTANKVAYLSIPGAGGAASSYGITNSEIQEQTLTIEQLWDRGIRCFEFMVDRPSSQGSSYLGNMPVLCGVSETGLTLKEAMDKVTGRLKEHPQEFAVVIIGYQDKDVDSYDRQAGAHTTLTTGWSASFHQWWNEYSFSGTATVNNTTITHAKAELTSSTTVEGARGKLFCIVRPMGIGIDGGWHTGIASHKLGVGGSTKPYLGYEDYYNRETGPYVSALGWGCHPDQWYARGWGKLVFNNTTTFAADQGGVSNRPYSVSKTEFTNTEMTYTVPNTTRFEYKFVTAPGTANNYEKTTAKCIVQDWRRVVPDEGIRTQYKIGKPTDAGALTGYSYISNNATSWYINWAPSVDEKWTDITSTLQKSMSDNTGTYSLYINSLCGYFVDPEYPISVQPRATFQRYNNVYYLDDKFNTTTYVGTNNLQGDEDKPSRLTSWGPYATVGGLGGNIEDYADWVNNKFYNYLLTLLANNQLNGPTGIVLMDRVSNSIDNPAGYYIPQIIISNNFGASATSNVRITYGGNLGETDQMPAREQN